MSKTEEGTQEPEKNEKKTKTCFCCIFPRRRATSKNTITQNLANPMDSFTAKCVYSNQLPKNISAGTIIRIHGSILNNCDRFAIDLKRKSVDKGPPPDIAFHLNPRLDRRYIVRNSRIGGDWGTEETASIVKYSLERNKKFAIVIFVAPDEFLVSINEEHFCSYRFRLPLSTLEVIEVLGDLEIEEVAFKKWTMYPLNPKATVTIDESQHDVPINHNNNISIPCTGHLRNGFNVGCQLNIYGRVKLLPHSFYINLQDGAQLWPHPIIPMHFNARFSMSSDNNLLVRNAWLNGRWGQEERTSLFQFSPGSSFNLAIRRYGDHFSVWVDGQLTGEFKSRAPVNKIDVVYIHGDVVINQILLHNKYVDHKKKS